MGNDRSEEGCKEDPEQPVSGLLAGEAWDVHGVRGGGRLAMAGS
jgi:hypothetical protein